MPPKVPSEKEFDIIAHEAAKARSDQRQAETSKRVLGELHGLGIAAFKDAPNELRSREGSKLIKYEEEHRSIPPTHCITRYTAWQFQPQSEHEGEKYTVGFRCKQQKKGWTGSSQLYLKGGEIVPEDWQEEPVSLEMMVRHPATETEKTFPVAEISLDSLIIFNEDGSSGQWYVPVLAEGVQEAVSTVRDTLALLS